MPGMVYPYLPASPAEKGSAPDVSPLRYGED